MGGNDLLYGDDGHDGLYGGPGDDTMRGGSGDDRLEERKVFGGSGDDTLYGDTGDDALYGGPGNDTLNSMFDRGADLVDCGAGIDTVKKGPYPNLDRFVGCERFVS
jgi:Ca2+-binding RTX toxin-like protein